LAVTIAEFRSSRAAMDGQIVALRAVIEAKDGELASATCASRQPYTSRHARHEAHRHSSRNHTKSVRTVLVNQFAQMIQNQKFLELLRLRRAISWLTDAGFVEYRGFHNSFGHVAFRQL
jgi:hypothetical protein